jgi:hypothetical protein
MEPGGAHSAAAGPAGPRRTTMPLINVVNLEKHFRQGNLI